MPVRLDQDAKQESSAFGKRLREIRNRQELFQDALADATDIHPTAIWTSPGFARSGGSPIGRMERGSREPRLTTILRLARGLGVPPGELLNSLEAAAKPSAGKSS